MATVPFSKSPLRDEAKKNLDEAWKTTEEIKTRLRTFEEKLSKAQRAIFVPPADYESSGPEEEVPFYLKTNSLYSHIPINKRRFQHEQSRRSAHERYLSQERPEMDKEENRNDDDLSLSTKAQLYPVSYFLDERQIDVEDNIEFSVSQPPNLTNGAQKSRSTEAISKIPKVSSTVARKPRVLTVKSRRKVAEPVIEPPKTNIMHKRVTDQNVRVERIRQRLEASKQRQIQRPSSEDSDRKIDEQTTTSSSRSSSARPASGPSEKRKRSNSSSNTIPSTLSSQSSSTQSSKETSKNEPPSKSVHRRVVSPPTKRRSAPPPIPVPAESSKYLNRSRPYDSAELRKFIVRKRMERKHHVTEDQSHSHADRSRDYNERSVKKYMNKKKEDRKSMKEVLKEKNSREKEVQLEKMNKVLERQKARSKMSTMQLLIESTDWDAKVEKTKHHVEIDKIRHRHQNRMHSTGDTGKMKEKVPKEKKESSREALPAQPLISFPRENGPVSQSESDKVIESVVNGIAADNESTTSQQMNDSDLPSSSLSTPSHRRNSGRTDNSTVDDGLVENRNERENTNLSQHEQHEEELENKSDKYNIINTLMKKQQYTAMAVSPEPAPSLVVDHSPPLSPIVAQNASTFPNIYRNVDPSNVVLPEYPPLTPFPDIFNEESAFSGPINQSSIVAEDINDTHRSFSVSQSDNRLSDSQRERLDQTDFSLAAESVPESGPLTLTPKSALSSSIRDRTDRTSNTSSGQISPGVLHLRLSAGLNYLDSVESCIRQVSDVDRLREVTTAQQQAVAAGYLVKAQQASQESREYEIRSEFRHEENERVKSQLEQTQTELLRAIATANERMTQQPIQQPTNSIADMSQIASAAAASAATAAVLSVLKSDKLKNVSSTTSKSVSSSSLDRSSKSSRKSSKKSNKTPEVLADSEVQTVIDSSVKSTQTLEVPTVAESSVTSTATVEIQTAADSNMAVKSTQTPETSPSSRTAEIQTVSDDFIAESPSAKAISIEQEISDEKTESKDQTKVSSSTAASASSSDPHPTSSWSNEKKEFGLELVRQAQKISANNSARLKARNNLLEQRVAALKNYFAAQIAVIHSQKRYLRTLPNSKEQLDMLKEKEDSILHEHRHLRKEAKSSAQSIISEVFDKKNEPIGKADKRDKYKDPNDQQYMTLAGIDNQVFDEQPKDCAKPKPSPGQPQGYKDPRDQQYMTLAGIDNQIFDEPKDGAKPKPSPGQPQGYKDPRDQQYMTLAGLDNQVFDQKPAPARGGGPTPTPAQQKPGYKDPRDQQYMTLAGMDNQIFDEPKDGAKPKPSPGQPQGYKDPRDQQYMTLAGMDNQIFDQQEPDHPSAQPYPPKPKGRPSAAPPRRPRDPKDKDKKPPRDKQAFDK